MQPAVEVVLQSTPAGELVILPPTGG